MNMDRLFETLCKMLIAMGLIGICMAVFLYMGLSAVDSADRQQIFFQLILTVIYSALMIFIGGYSLKYQYQPEKYDFFMRLLTVIIAIKIEADYLQWNTSYRLSLPMVLCSYIPPVLYGYCVYKFKKPET